MKSINSVLSRLLAALLAIGCFTALLPGFASADSEIGLPSVYDTERPHDALSPVAAQKEVVCTQKTFDQVNELFERNCWTDGVFITPPTEDKVNKYLLFTPYASDRELMNGKTVYTAAVNCVMSGCTPQLMPVCIAIVEAMNDPEILAALRSSHANTPYAWLNGPVSRQLGIDCEQGMISDMENKALARFINLALNNIVGIDVNDSSSTFGAIEPFVFAENEEACERVGWAPYHVEQGYALNDNTLTLSTATCWGNNLTPATADAEQTMKLIADDVTEKQDAALGAGNAQSCRTVLIVEPIADNLADKYGTKSTLESALVETAQRPFALRAYAKYWADPDGAHTDADYQTYYDQLLAAESDSVTTNHAAPDWYFQILKGASPRISTSSALRAGDTRILVCGDASRNKAQTLAGGKSVTVRIRLPEKWDALLTQINQDPKTFRYLEPIRTFCLGTDAPTYNTSEPLTSEDVAKFSEPMPLYMYSIVSPVGVNTIEMIEQADRLNGLAGKRIAMVGRSFGAPCRNRAESG